MGWPRFHILKTHETSHKRNKTIRECENWNEIAVRITYYTERCTLAFNAAKHDEMTEAINWMNVQTTRAKPQGWCFLDFKNKVHGRDRILRSTQNMLNYCIPSSPSVRERMP